MAIAGTVGAPIAASADGDIYASARVGLEYADTGAVSDFDVRSFASRFGARGETDLGNGMTGYGRYEWDVDMEDGDSISVRHRYVGLKGDFGDVYVGQAYHTYYNYVYGPTDNPWWGSGYFYPSPGRTDGGITYAGGTGMFSFGVTGYFFRDSEEESPEAFEAAVSFGIGDMTLAVGVADFSGDSALIADDETVTGVVLHGISLGEVSLGVGFQTADEADADAYVIEALIGSGYIHFEAASTDDADPNSLTLGYTQSLGRNTSMWYEAVVTDADTGDSDDDLTALRAVLKYDIL